MIRVDVVLPGEEKYFLDIYRREGTARKDSVNRYEVVLLDVYNNDEKKSVFFTHRYGDGWLKCVELALRALQLVKKTEDEE